MDRMAWSLGATAPVQQSPVTCGSAALTVARMLADPAFASWVVAGVGRDGGRPDGRTEQSRFAEYERVVMGRTNALVGPGARLQLPWPRALGTPPWGARREREQGAAARGARYRLHVVRFASAETLAATYRRLVRLVHDGRPALLYVGNALAPRHVTLVLPGDGDTVLDVYDPATGTVTALDESRYGTRRLALAGWDVPWVLVQPTEVEPVGRSSP
jgi:hypothetical protein